ncbi:MAG: hypothetical protein AAGI66_10030 [Cyanobacteria bacterium P01_H01_bin.74]
MVPPPHPECIVVPAHYLAAPVYYMAVPAHYLAAPVYYMAVPVH